MTFDEALSGVTKLGLDTAPIIYFLEENVEYLERVEPFFQAIDAGRVQAFAGVITLMEVLVKPLTTGDTDLEQKYRDILENGKNFTLCEIGAQTARAAADLRARYSLRTPDALQLAVALQQRCEAFLTNDEKLKRVTDLRVIVL